MGMSWSRTVGHQSFIFLQFVYVHTFPRREIDPQCIHRYYAICRIHSLPIHTHDIEISLQYSAMLNFNLLHNSHHTEKPLRILLFFYYLSRTYFSLVVVENTKILGMSFISGQNVKASFKAIIYQSCFNNMYVILTPNQSSKLLWKQHSWLMLSLIYFSFPPNFDSFHSLLLLIFQDCFCLQPFVYTKV